MSSGYFRHPTVHGDRVVFVTGTGVIDNTHNLLVVHEVSAN